MGQNRRMPPAAEKFLLIAQSLQEIAKPNSHFKKRKEPRYARSLSISVQPLDDDFRPDGDSFWLVSRDISLKGIGLISSDPIVHSHVRVGLLGETTTVIGRVCHNSSIGQNCPLYLVGIEFLNEN